jgi:microcystin-dependent protein
MSSPYLAQILMFGGNFAPKNYALCNGQTLSIQQNQALFSLLGTTYGGNGTNTFALPNLQSSLPLSWGQGTGLSGYNLGQTGGSASVTLNQSTIPTHNHTFNTTRSAASSAAIGSGSNLPAKPTVTTNASAYATGSSPALALGAMAAAACGIAGGNQPHTNLMPSLCITFAIALNGVFPSRN